MVEGRDMMIGPKFCLCFQFHFFGSAILELGSSNLFLNLCWFAKFEEL